MKSAVPPDARILVVDDDADIRATLEMILEGEGCCVSLAEDGASGYDEAVQGDFDLVLTDFRMPGMGGLELIQKLVEEIPACPVVLMTAHGNTDLAIEATKLGAYDYLLKPFEMDDLLAVVAKSVSASRSKQSRRTASSGRETKVPRSEPKMLGNSRAMQTVYKEIGHIAPTGATVLITGETGTGKELVAKAIHHHSRRSDGPFVAVNCGAIPENLLESELFGHVKGAFTGADAVRRGRFEEAAGGTLFLDEIGDMPLPVQVKLLRVLQEGTFQALGSSEEKQADVRVVAATHRDMAAMVEEEKFREDLFFRLSAMRIPLPALRERKEDIHALVSHFLLESASEYGIAPPALGKNLITHLESQDWRGNIRELQNVVRYIVLHSRGFAIGKALVDEALSGNALAQVKKNGGEDFPNAWIESFLDRAIAGEVEGIHSQLTDELDRQLITLALRKSGGHLGKVSAWLGISRVTLRKKMGDLAIERDG